MLGSKKKKEGKEKEAGLTDLLNELIGIEIDNRKIQDGNQKKMAEMHDNVAKLLEEQREANEQMLDAIGRLEGAIGNVGAVEAKVEQTPEGETEPEVEEEPPVEEEEAPEEKKEEDVLKRLKQLREKRS